MYTVESAKTTHQVCVHMRDYTRDLKKPAVNKNEFWVNIPG